MVIKLEQLREQVQLLIGTRGDGAALAELLASAGQGGGDTTAPDPLDDTTPPPTPVGFSASAGISNIFTECDPQTYTQGGGHLSSVLYGAKRADGAPARVFADAVVIDEFLGTVRATPSDPSTTWALWLKWKTRAGVESTDPAGGTNGIEVTTGLDVRNLIDSLTEAAQRPGGPLTKTMFRADLFGIGPELDFNQESTPVGTAVGQLWLKPSTGVTKTWTGAAWSTFNVPLPFIVNTTSTTIDGVTYPAGVYMDQAIIYNLTALIARLGTAWIDDAMIADLSASKLTAGSIAVGDYIQSAGYTGVGATEWRIDGNGVARFSGVIVKGQIIATTGSIGGADILSTYVESTNYNGTGLGWRLDNGLGKIFCGKLLVSNTGATRVFDTEATGTNPVLKIGTALLLRGDGSGQLGDLELTGDLNVSGSLQIGQTAYNTGTGVWAGKVGSVFKVSMGNPAGPYFLYDGTDIRIKSPTFDTFTATISGGNINCDRWSGDPWPTRTVTPSGGKTPYSFQWMLIPTKYEPLAPTDPAASVPMVLLGSTTATCEIQGNGVNLGGDRVYGHLGCLITDANGRNTFAKVSYVIKLEPPDPGPIGGAE